MSKSSKSLLFVTYQYPFLPGEYFIEEEIEYLAGTFDTVWVLPGRCLFWKPKEPPRQMPDNVKLLDPRDASWGQKLYWYIAGLAYTVIILLRWRSVWSGNPSVRVVSMLKDLKAVFKVSVTTLALRTLLRPLKCEGELIGYSYWRNFSAASLALLKAGGMLKRLFLRCHRVDIYHPQRWTSQALIHAYADGVFSVSMDGYLHLVNEKGLDASIIEVQRLGVAIPSVCAAASEDGVIRIVSVSNAVPVKRVELIAEVISKLPMPVSWTHIGDGPTMSLVRECCKDMPSDHSFNFLGRLSNQQVLDYYSKNAVDIFINLSESEGVPVSIMEALAHGIPVVATNVGGSGEVVNDENGRLIDVAASIEEIVAAIADLCGAGDLIQCRKEARRTALTMCSSDANYKSFCQRILR